MYSARCHVPATCSMPMSFKFKSLRKGLRLQTHSPGYSPNPATDEKSAFVNAYGFFSNPFLKLIRADVRSNVRESRARLPTSASPVGASGVCAVRSSSASRFQRPSLAMHQIQAGLSQIQSRNFQPSAHQRHQAELRPSPRSLAA